MIASSQDVPASDIEGSGASDTWNGDGSAVGEGVAGAGAGGSSWVTVPVHDAATVTAIEGGVQEGPHAIRDGEWLEVPRSDRVRAVPSPDGLGCHAFLDPSGRIAMARTRRSGSPSLAGAEAGTVRR